MPDYHKFPNEEKAQESLINEVIKEGDIVHISDINGAQDTEQMNCIAKRDNNNRIYLECETYIYVEGEPEVFTTKIYADNISRGGSGKKRKTRKTRKTNKGKKGKKVVKNKSKHMRKNKNNSSKRVKRTRTHKRK
jgi:hypothetical protein